MLMKLKLWYLYIALFCGMPLWGQYTDQVNDLLYKRDGESALALIDLQEKEFGKSILLDLKRNLATTCGNIYKLDTAQLKSLKKESFHSLSEEAFLIAYLTGLADYLKGDYESATRAFLEAVEVIKFSRELPAYAKLREVSCYGFLSHIFHELGDDELAQTYLELEHDKAVEFHDSISISITANNLGIIYKNKGEYEKAYFSYMEALQISQARKDEIGIVKALNNLGLLDEMVNKDDPYLSIELYELAQEHAEASGVENINKPNNLLLQEDYEAALALYESKMIQALSTENYPELCTALLGMGRCYDSLGMDKKAKEAYQTFVTFQAEANHLRLAEQTKEIEAKYKLREKESHITYLQKEKELQLIKDRERGLIFWIVIIIIIMVLAVSLLLSQRRLLVANVKQEQTENQLLRSQMNPHFVFNTLSVIQSLIQTEQYDDAVFSLGKFAKLNRKILNNSKQKLITITEEIAALQDYIDLQKMRFSEQIQYQITAKLSNPSALFIPPNLLQPLVENSIKHGVLPKKEPGNIEVLFEVENGQLICKVIDSGIGYHVSQEKQQAIPGQSNRKSMALGILKGRLTFLEKTYKQKAGIEIEQRFNGKQIIGTQITLTLPLIKEHD